MYRQSSLNPSILSRFSFAFIVLLIVMLSLSLYNYYQAWLQSQQIALNTLATRMAYQIEDYRYQASHLYKLANDKTNTPYINEDSITEVRHDLYWLSSANQTIDAIVFGPKKLNNLSLAAKLANYMEIVWGARNEYNSMYFLNGIDNTLVLVTTHSILKPELRYKESYLTLTAEDKRADMLNQSTQLDRREIISNLQKQMPENVFYYTYRLMFNSPGQLTSVISFDISINSLMPYTLQGNLLTINPRPGNTGTNEPNVSVAGTNLVFSQPINGSNYQLYYHVSLKNIIFSVLSYNFWLIICMLGIIVLTLLSTIIIRKKLISPSTNMLRELQFKDAISADIINNIAYGILVFDFNNNKKIVSNSIANQLLPSMDLIHIKDMAANNHDVIQVSIDDNVYEVILIDSLTLENTYLFIISNKDKEALTQKRQELATREYQKNIQLRKVIFENMCNEILPTLSQIDKLIAELAPVLHGNNQTSAFEIENHVAYINRWFKNIELLIQFEKQTNTLNAKPVSLSKLVSQYLKQNLPLLRNKGLSLYFHNNLNPETLVDTDPTYLEYLLQLIIEYSISTTNFGKISVALSYNSDKQVILINIKDSGTGLTTFELNNLQSPFSGKIMNAAQLSRSGVTFYLCKTIVKKMNGSFSIQSSNSIGTHYEITLPATHLSIVNEYPALLEDTYIRLNIHNADISRIVRNTLTNYGAEFIDLYENSPHADWDLMITDNDDENFANTIKVAGNLTDLKSVAPNYFEVNYNFSDDLIDAISQLIENSAIEDEVSLTSVSVLSLAPAENESIESALNTYQLILANSDYKDLFVTTVPIDINKLYNSESVDDFTELKDTAHRLKGVFAMLEFTFLHKLCEDLERFIADENGLEIKNCIRELDFSVKKLMPKGTQ